MARNDAAVRARKLGAFAFSVGFDGVRSFASSKACLLCLQVRHLF